MVAINTVSTPTCCVRRVLTMTCFVVVGFQYLDLTTFKKLSNLSAPYVIAIFSRKEGCSQRRKGAAFHVVF